MFFLFLLFHYFKIMAEDRLLREIVGLLALWLYLCSCVRKVQITWWGRKHTFNSYCLRYFFSWDILRRDTQKLHYWVVTRGITQSMWHNLQVNTQWLPTLCLCKIEVKVYMGVELCVSPSPFACKYYPSDYLKDLSNSIADWVLWPLSVFVFLFK